MWERSQVGAQHGAVWHGARGKWSGRHADAPLNCLHACVRRTASATMHSALAMLLSAAVGGAQAFAPAPAVVAALPVRAPRCRTRPLQRCRACAAGTALSRVRASLL